MVNLATVIDRIKSRFSERERTTTKPGIFHFDYQENGERSRIHLRIDPDGSGLLIVNASRIMHLNPTAAQMARFILQKTPQETALQALSKSYSVTKSRLSEDYAQIAYQIGELIKPDGACPIHDLNLEVTPPFSARPAAPYRMDLAITYRCNNDCSHCYNARIREYPELSTSDWHQVLDRLWAIGIPHVVFTGGEPTLRKDLPELIAHAQQNGQITGINTNGRRLSDSSYAEELVNAGLDHVQITLESHDPHIHDSMVNSHGAWKQTVSGIRNVLETPLYVMTNTTMLTTNSPQLRQTLEFLSALGVPTIGLNALIYSGRGLSVNSGLAETELPDLLNLARQITAEHNQHLIWYTPTQYCNFDPVQLELGVKGCTAAMYNMCIEPNGDVIPCQSYYQCVGNILTSPWKKIWNHDLSIHLREHKYIPEKCLGCALLRECGGGCPLTMQSGRN
ncbi:MAG TPA: radical SAM protein [Anaerolineales bacterium]|nr:radical SAM protein [Anaerolineales bacterium]